MAASDTPHTPNSPTGDAPRTEDDATFSVGGRAAFSHEPKPRKTQPPASVTSEDFATADYAESTNYTAKGAPRMADGGYRRSRSGEKKMKENLRYGQYLEVPKGKQPIFQQSRSSRRTVFAIAAILVAVAVVLFFCWMFFWRSMS